MSIQRHSSTDKPDGSLKQLWMVSSSLMISFLSMVIMMFIDRLFLAHYSTESLNAATSAGTLHYAVSLMFVTFAAMGEVFVAQYNGSGQYKKLGHPTWQMVWFSGFSFIFFFIFSFFGSDFFMKNGFMNSNELEYFRWNSYFAPWFILLTAFSTFYIGQRKTCIIKWMGVLGNGLNIILDPIFIFGKFGFPEMGIKGAAIATGISGIAQVFVIVFLFFQKRNQKRFGTGDWRFNRPLFMKCLRVATPSALFVLFELLGWGIFYMMMRYISIKHILVSSITQSILFLFLFFGLGLEKGAAAISGNLIGAKKLLELKRLFWSGIKLALIFGGGLLLLLGTTSEMFIDLFLKNSESLVNPTTEISPEMLSEVKLSLKFTIIILIAFLTLETIRLFINGLLASVGDTFCSMILGVISIWCCMLLPTYFFVVIPKAPIETAFIIWIFYGFAAAALLWIRFVKGKWKKKMIIVE